MRFGRPTWTVERLERPSTASPPGVAREAFVLSLSGEGGGLGGGKMGEGAVVGRGEAAPLVGYSPERPEDVEAVFRGLPPGMEVASLEDVERLVSQVPEHVPSARFALETALLDGLAQGEGTTLEALLGDRGGPLALSALVHDGEEAMRARRAGAAAVKVKVGRDPEGDVDRVRGVRRAVDDLSLRLDANGAWTPGEARERLLAFSPFQIEFVEEPVGRGVLDLEPLPVPVALDESLLRPEVRAALPRLAEAGVVHAVVLKLALHGGAFPARALARRAEGLGLRVVVTHMFGGAIERRVSRAFARSLGVPEEAHGLWESRP